MSIDLGMGTASAASRTGCATRRDALRRLLWLAGSSPLFAQGQGRNAPATIYPPSYSEEVMGPVNVHEIEEVAKKKVHPLAYDYIAGGSANELTLRANREAFSRAYVRRRVGVDVSKIDTSLELLGKKLEFPILLGAGGAKNLVYPDGDRVTAQAAAHTKAIYLTGPSDWMAKLQGSPQAPMWWAASLGFATKASAEAFARRAEDAGASAISVSVDYPYTAPRDRNNRNKFDYAWVQTGIPADAGKSKPRTPAIAGMIQAYTPSLTWNCVDWLRGATKLPLILKGIVTAEDARLAVERGAQAIVVSNHGGRTLDGMIPTLYALPEVVDAVSARIPVLMDGGIRRGGDIMKALGLGAKAILIGRPYYWGLAAFGQVGVQRVVELLHAELRVAMGLAGIPNVASIDRSLVGWYTEPLPVNG
ncbi:MAG: alpha-hydroxy-acid oxidizing protein [Acidobacteria bacterium]|nr:alpha-hydroxy-acid oxidizing protein [Acidobacteriota bacterium]